ncbi:uncharacterized protein DUF4407 [Pontibacter ummariensis]|uniref:DUF4407 domain-containing protein n=1 Tax=Pontibacter ummariensis TaxID=1610492 RepID=A0A239CWW4_9BACT|nr:DUF4407 domain-containing protein [Pontibacter ummariensis]PRY14790.1 uncharacterized protein DUF4407 [Pontibacter ummariensis]SNS24409.1 protein of unknown function [Pontibacter ummariensis]
MKNFFWWCAGADDTILEKCSKSEHIKYAGVGATVLFTGLLASISGGYALYTVFDSVPMAVAFGLFWGAVIFNLDRFIVSTIRKEGKFWKELLMVTPRILLALVLAVVISKPLELKIFDKEIQAVLKEKQAELAIQHKSLVNQQFAEVDSVKSEIAGIREEVAAKLEERNRLYEALAAEADGTGGTGKIGKGPIYEEKKLQYDKVDEELKLLQADAQQRILLREQRIAELMKQYDETVAEGQESFQNYDGLMARISALDELPWLPVFFITLLFICLETAPIFTKLISSKGPYDDILKGIEHERTTQEMQRVAERQKQYDTRTAVAEAKFSSRMDYEIDAKREEERIKSDAHLEVVRESAAVWKERKLKDIHRSPNTAAEILNDNEENGYYQW